MSDDRISVVFLDDHAMVGAALAMTLNQTPKLDVQSLQRSRELFRLLDAGGSVDVVLLDVHLRGDPMSAAAVTAALLERDIPALLVTSLDEGRELREALVAGAASYISKSAPCMELIGRIDEVAAGSAEMPPEMAALIADEPAVTLTPHEVPVLTLLAQGLTYQQIASKRTLSPETIKSHIRNIRAKYEAAGIPARTRHELTMQAYRDGLVELPPGPDR